MSEARTTLPFWRQFGYALGDAGMNFYWNFVATFAMFYMTNIVGAKAAAVGMVMLLARLADGFSDVLIGSLIDRTRTRHGKARPWLFWSTFPLAAGTAMLFNVPAGLSETGQIAYFAVVYVLMGAFFYTAGMISYNALVALCTDDPHTRVTMGSIRFVMVMVVILFMSAFTTRIADAFGGGQEGWTAVSLLYAFVLLVLMLLSVFSVHEMPGRGEEQSRESLGVSLRTVIHSRSFLLMLAIMVLGYIGMGVAGTTGIYVATYILGDPGMLGAITTANLVPLMVALPFVPAITARTGMRRINIAGLALMIIGNLVAWFGQASHVGLFTGLVIAGLGSAPFFSTFPALIAEVGDHIRLTTGRNIEGMTSTLTSVGVKVGMGIGGAVVGWVLSATGFDGLSDSPAPATITAILVMFLLVPLGMSVIRLGLFAALRVEEDNARLREVVTPPPLI